jgi:hypothetical protein
VIVSVPRGSSTTAGTQINCENEMIFEEKTKQHVFEEITKVEERRILLAV